MMHDPGLTGSAFALDLAGGGSFRLIAHRQRREPMIIELTVTGMSCGGCAASLQKALLAQPSVRTATVDFASRKAAIESELSKAELIALIEARGFQVE